MSASELGLVVSVFLACAVEAVEALTIVMAVGFAREWSSALAGVGSALLVLSATVAAAGSALGSLPFDDVRLLIGATLLALGLQWLRKAVLRAAGRKAMRDERAAFARERAAAMQASRAPAALDAYAFAVAFKGVLIEGFEVVLIVVTFGANGHRTALAALAAGAAVALVVALGAAVRAPLARVPENTMKLAVGVLLCSYGVFWAAAGAGASWPGGDGALLVLIPAVLGASLLAAAAMRRGALR